MSTKRHEAAADQASLRMYSCTPTLCPTLAILTPDLARALADLLTRVPLRTVVAVAVVGAIVTAVCQMTKAAAWPTVVGLVAIAAVLAVVATTLAVWPAV